MIVRTREQYAVRLHPARHDGHDEEPVIIEFDSPCAAQRYLALQGRRHRAELLVAEVEERLSAWRAVG